MEHRGKLHRIAVAEHMHVHRERLVSQQVIVQGRHLDAARRKFRHDRIDLGFGQHEIAHHHALIAHLFEGEPTAEREAGFQLDAVERDLQIGARQPDAINAAWCRRTGLSKRLADLALPLIGGKGETGRGGKQSRKRELSQMEPHGRPLLDVRPGIPARRVNLVSPSPS